jgi:hypothetical protein
MKNKVLTCLALSVIICIFSFNAHATLFTVDDTSEGKNYQGSIEILNDGTNEVTFKIDLTNDTLGDIRGVFFNFSENMDGSNFSVTGTGSTENAITAWSYDDDKIKSVGSPSNNINGIDGPKSFDFGVEIGTQGASNDFYEYAEFRISSDTALNIGDNFGVRIMSAGPDQSGSAKLSGSGVSGGDEDSGGGAQVPEPVTAILLGTGILGIAGYRKFKKV